MPNANNARPSASTRLARLDEPTLWRRLIPPAQRPVWDCLADSIPATAENYLNLVCYCGTIAGIAMVDREFVHPLPHRAARRWKRCRRQFERRRDALARQLGLALRH
jgi:hypothetical protein